MDDVLLLYVIQSDPLRTPIYERLQMIFAADATPLLFLLDCDPNFSAYMNKQRNNSF